MPSPITRKRKLDDGRTITLEHPKKHLRIDIPSKLPSPTTNCTPSSLFSASSTSSLSASMSSPNTLEPESALRTAPPISGLYFTPSLQLPELLASQVLEFCMSTYFHNPNINQIMLFTRFDKKTKTNSLPKPLLELLAVISTLLQPHIPSHAHSLLFPSEPTQARQVILNLYNPGEGITPHVDLLRRFGDGIIGVSLGSGCVMQFVKVPSPISGEVKTQTVVPEFGRRDTVPSDGDTRTNNRNYRPSQNANNESWDLYLPERSILVLSEDARYKWTHGINKRTADYVSECHSQSIPVTSNDKPFPSNTNILTPPPPVTTDILSQDPCFPSDPTDYGTNYVSKARWIERGIRLSITFRWLLPGADIVGGDT